MSSRTVDKVRFLWFLTTLSYLVHLDNNMPSSAPTRPASPLSRPTSTPPDLDISNAGPQMSNICIDDSFDFQIVVFQVENTLFRVLKNGFNVPGTIFESMFALPQAPTDIGSSLVEGNSFEKPIHLPGIKADHFRVFLRTLYPLYV